MLLSSQSSFRMGAQLQLATSLQMSTPLVKAKHNPQSASSELFSADYTTAPQTLWFRLHDTRTKELACNSEKRNGSLKGEELLEMSK